MHEEHPGHAGHGHTHESAARSTGPEIRGDTSSLQSITLDYQLARRHVYQYNFADLSSGEIDLLTFLTQVAQGQLDSLGTNLLSSTITLSALLGTLIIVGITVVIGVVVEKKTPKLEAKKRDVRPQAGESPETAIRVLKLQRCCEREMVRNLDDHVRYGGKTLLVARFTCTTCTTKRSFYVAEP